MNTVWRQCHNEDSCPPFREHRFPASDERVSPMQSGNYPIVGGEGGNVYLHADLNYEVLDLLTECHEVMLNAHGHNVWLPIDDIAGLGDQFRDLDRSDPKAVAQFLTKED